ncbi:MAG: spore germination protein, partial [Clostridia bacterium]|nr:spore germination protein [Clostridia bacterium]
TIGFTERPDVVAAKLLEGRIAVMVDGSPVVLTLPFLFHEYLQSSEDYYNSFYFTSINRLLRIIGLIITVSAPAVYVAILTYHQEIIPTPLLLSISAARQGIPFPTIIEVLLMLLFFEIMRETGIRMPTAIGQALSIVGALVLGQASVEAKFFSAPVVIVVALTGITGLILPKMKGAIITIRILLLIVSSFIGLYGYVFGITCVLLLLCSMRSFGVPYLMDLTSLNPEDMKDTAIRAPIWFMKSRSDMIARNRVRLKTHRGKSS